MGEFNESTLVFFVNHDGKFSWYGNYTFFNKEWHCVLKSITSVRVRVKIKLFRLSI